MHRGMTTIRAGKNRKNQYFSREKRWATLLENFPRRGFVQFLIRAQSIGEVQEARAA